jgi:hypothetical protein
MTADQNIGKRDSAEIAYINFGSQTPAEVVLISFLLKRALNRHYHAGRFTYPLCMS